MQKQSYLAPWGNILALPGYHGDATEEEIKDLLHNEPKGSFVICNYDPTNEVEEMFTIAFKWEIPTEQGNKEERIVWTKGMTNNIDGFRKENIRRHFIRERHPLECFYGKPPMKPMKKTIVFSLKQWCRASISQNFKYETIKRIKEEGGLPGALFEFIIDRSSSTPPTNKDFLLCEQGPWGECVYPSMAMREEEWFGIVSNNKIVLDKTGQNHAMIVMADTDSENSDEDNDELNDFLGVIHEI